jgi:5,10-methylenetetrahydromethanopterin reductase
VGGSGTDGREGDVHVSGGQALVVEPARLVAECLGVDRRKPLSAVRDTIAACRGLFSGEEVTMTGEGFALHGARLGVPCRSDLEIWLAGRGPRMLALGGESADGVMLDFIHQDALADQVGLIRSHPDGSPRVRRRRIAFSTMVITNDRAMANTKPHMTYRLVDSPQDIKQRIGLSESDAERIRHAMGGGLHEAAEHVRDEWVLPFVISGTESDCAAALARTMDRHAMDEFLLPILDFHHAPELMVTVADVLART